MSMQSVHCIALDLLHLHLLHLLHLLHMHVCPHMRLRLIPFL